MEHKINKAEILSTDEDQGIVECIFSVMGILDEGNDIVHNGSFTKTWNERAQKVKLLDSHNFNSVLDALGKPLEFRELSRAELPLKIQQEYPEATGGAWAKVQFNMKTTAGRDAFYHLQAGDVDEWSYGYDAVDKDHTKISWRGKEVVARNLRGIKLFELSPVVWGMNSATTTTGAKSAPTEGKPYKPIHRGDKWEVYKLDSDGNPTGESLGSHDSEEEAREQIEALYANESKNKAINLSQQVEDVRQAFMAQYNPPNGRWYYWVNTVYDEYLIVCYEGEDGVEYYQVPYSQSTDGYVFSPMGEWVEGSYEFIPGVEALKAGRVLSARSAARIKAVMDELHTLLMEAGLMEMPAEDDDKSAGPPESADTSTSNAQEAGTPVQDDSTRIQNLIKIEQEKLNLLEV